MATISSRTSAVALVIGDDAAEPVLLEALGRVGCAARRANPQDVGTFLAEVAPDLMVIDLCGSPAMDGLCRRLKPAVPIPTLLLSGDPPADSESALVLETGVEAYVRRPFRLADVLPPVATLLRLTRAGREAAVFRADAERSSPILTAVVTSSNDAIISRTIDGTVLSWNPAAERLFGWTAGEVIGRSVEIAFPPEYLPTLPDLSRRVASGEFVPPFETVRVRKDGTPVDVLVSVSPVRDRDGRIIGASSITRDLSERRQARDALRRTEDVHHVLADMIPQLVWTAGADGTIEYANRRWLDYTGVAPAGLSQVVGSDLVHPEDLPRARGVWDRSNRDQVPWEAEFRLRAADGTWRWHVGRAVPYRDVDGRLLKWIGTMTDIEDHRRAERALRLRDRAIHAVTEGIVIADASLPDFPISYVSTGFERLTGYTAAEVMGRNCRLLQGPETDRETVAGLREAIREGRPTLVEILNYRRDGTPFWNRLSVSPVRDETGRPTHFVGVLSDVTQRRRLEEQYRQSQKMEAVGRLAGGIAHDFNNLLTVITGYGDLVLSALPPDSQSHDRVGEMLKAAEWAAVLVRRLLAFSRNTVVTPTVLDLNTVVTDMEKLLRRTIGEDVELTTRLGAGLGRVKADPGQIEQVILNLAVNARDAMPDGGTLLIATENAEAEHPDALPSGEPAAAGPGRARWVVLTVTDTGSGMPPAVKERIFEPFFTTKSPGVGTGLGLATVHAIVEQMAGYIEVDSIPGAGSTFRVHLPRSRESVSEPRVVEHRRPTVVGHGTVLLVEDDEGVRGLSGQVLREHGYRVLEASAGGDALRLLETYRGPISLLVSDVVMPGLGGRQLAERLLATHPGMKVLFMSGYTDDQVVRYGGLSTEVGYLPKPFLPAGLIQKVRGLLGGAGS